MSKRRCAPRYLLPCNVVNVTERMLVIYGEDDYLRRQAEQEVRANFSEVTSLDVQQLRPDELVALVCQRDLFQPDMRLYVVRSKDEQRSLWKVLLAVQGKFCQALLFNCRKKSLSAAAQKTFKLLKAKLIACPAPRPHEYPARLQRICAQHGLQLDRGGRQLLLEHGGLHLDALANEVQKLALIFGQEHLNATDIAPHLGLLREDRSFAIIDLLLNKQYSRAQLVVEKLLQHGESALAILGVLAYFLRNVVLASEGQLKLAPRQVAHYRNLARDWPRPACLDLLAHCQQADMDLKTSRLRPELVLGSVLLRLPRLTTDARMYAGHSPRNH